MISGVMTFAKCKVPSKPKIKFFCVLNTYMLNLYRHYRHLPIF